MRSALVYLWASNPYTHSICNVESVAERQITEENLYIAAQKIVGGEKIWIPHHEDAMNAVFSTVRFLLKKTWQQEADNPEVGRHSDARLNFAEHGKIDARSEIIEHEKADAWSKNTWHEKADARPKNIERKKAAARSKSAKTSNLMQEMQMLFGEEDGD